MLVKDYEKKEKSTAELTVEFTPEEFEAAVNKAYLKGRGRISIPGFRKGKAPRRIIEAMYGTGAFYEDAVEELYPTALENAVKEKNLAIVGRPSVTDMSVGEDKSLTLKFLVSLYPEVKVEGYKGIAAPKPAVTVSDADIDRELGKVREQNAREETVEREARSGDIANIDFVGYMDGKPFEGGKGEDYDLELGSGTFIPGFEDQIVGHSVGDEFDVNVTFPEAYAPELAGKDATFKVTLKGVKMKELPELDDEFAKDVSEFDTLDEYKASIRKDLEKKRADEADRAFRDVVISRLVDKVEGEVPDAMVEEHLDQMVGNFRYNLSAQGMELEHYLSMMGMDEKALRDELRFNAEKEVKSDLAMEYIAKQESFEVSDEDVEAEYERLGKEYSMDVDSVKKAISADSIKTGLKLDKAKELVLSTAVEEKKETEDKE
ncbi:MAG: trigger factor [Oscillospiraceae bacterium]|nr:trigger factor [Oscillospiraceae bacterium]